MGNRKLIDWDTVEPLYRKGTLSNCQICEQYAADHVHSQTYSTTVTEGAIRKQAKQKGWQRDIADKVKAKVREKLVRNEVRDSNLDENQIIEEAAEAGANVVLRHQKEIARLTGIEESLMSELEKLNENNGVGSDGEVTNLKTRSSTLKDLTDIRAKRIALERQAHCVDDLSSKQGQKSIEDFLDSL